MRLRPLRGLLARSEGTAAIEFALILPVLVLIVTGVVEIGLTVRDSMRVQEAVSAGALYADQHGFDAAKISTAVTSAVSGAAITAAPAPAVSYGCPTASAITASAQGAACADGFYARTYVTVSAQMPRTQVFGAVFGLPDTLTATSTARLP